MILTFGFGTGVQEISVPDENLLGVLTGNPVNPGLRGGRRGSSGAA